MTKKITFLIIFLLAFESSAQKEESSLKEILLSLEEQHAVSFTYADQNIEGVLIKRPADSLSLPQKLNYLQEKTNLLFERLNKRFIAIQKRQTIRSFNFCGYIKDRKTKAAIEGVVLRSGDKFSVTNQEGYFSLGSIPVNATIDISSAGYNSTQLEAHKLISSICADIYLTPSVITLSEIVVSNYITQGIAKRFDGAIIVDTDNLAILPGMTEPDVLQTLQTLPGIQSFDESVSDINVRGGSNDQNLVLWNGIRMYQTGHFFGLISAFNPYLTDEVTLIKNGTSALYGRGVSSTLLINSDDEVAKTISGSAGLNMINGDAYLKIPVSSKSSLHLSSRRSITDLLSTPTYNQYFERIFSNTEITDPSNRINEVFDSNENFYFFDVSAKFLYDITSRDKLRINFLSIDNDLEYLENAIVNNEVLSRTSTLEQQNMATGISYRRLWTDKIKTNTELNLSSYELNAVNFDILSDRRLEQSNKVSDIGLSLDAKWLINNNYDLLGGYQFNEIGITNLENVNKPDFTSFIKSGTSIHSGFVEANYTSDEEKTFVTAGLKTNYYSKLGKTIFEPRFSINHEILEYLNLDILGEFKSQATTQVIDFQNDFLGVEKRRWILANGNDVPLTQSKQLSLGLTYDKKGFLTNLEAYYKQVNGITSSSQGFLNQFQFEREQGAYSSHGFDMLINKTFLEKLNTWLSYSYAETIYDFNEFTPSEFSSNFDVRHIVSVGSSYSSDKLEASVGLNWRTGRPFTPAIGVDNQSLDAIIYGAPNSLNLQSYFRLDASVEYHFMLSDKLKGQLGTSVWNITDHDNILNTYYQVSDQDELQQVDEYALGITPNILFRVTF